MGSMTGPDPAVTGETLSAVVRRASGGDLRALAELRSDRESLAPWNELRVCLRRARRAWAESASGGDGGRRGVLLKELAGATRRRCRPGDGPLERLLAGGAALAAARLGHLRRVDVLETASRPGQLKAAERELRFAERRLHDIRRARPACVI